MSELPASKRCTWALASQQYLDYHDQEWGVPVHDDRKLFAMLILEGAQAGLSWSLILKKRPGYLQAFDGFDAHKIALYDERKVQELLVNPEIVRNRNLLHEFSQLCQCCQSLIQRLPVWIDLQRVHASMLIGAETLTRCHPKCCGMA